MTWWRYLLYWPLVITDEFPSPLRWRHNDHAGVSNHRSRDCLLNRLFRRRSKRTSKLRVTGLCAGNSPGTGEFPAQRASYAENVSIWWRHHDKGPITGQVIWSFGISFYIHKNKLLNWTNSQVANDLKRNGMSLQWGRWRYEHNEHIYVER